MPIAGNEAKILLLSEDTIGHYKFLNRYSQLKSLLMEFIDEFETGVPIELIDIEFIVLKEATPCVLSEEFSKKFEEFREKSWGNFLGAAHLTQA